MLSIIVCSNKDDEYFHNFTANLQDTVGVPFEVIRIDNSKNKHSIFSAYNLGASRSTMPYLCFVHEDVKFHTKNWGNKLITHLSVPKTGIVGIAGCTALTRIPTPWTWNPSFINIIQSNNNSNKSKKTAKFPKNTNRTRESIVMLDGVFLCMRKDLFGTIKFDEIIFDDFHAYDFDICIQSHVQGYNNYMANDILIEHFSRGNRDYTYYNNLLKVYKKWEKHLPLYAENFSEKDRTKALGKERMQLDRLIIKLSSTRFDKSEIMRTFARYSHKINPQKRINLNRAKFLLAVSRLFFHNQKG
ncbi:MAG: hypothetical protein GX361_04440 [Bacteroidales bacterium]|nr:hypothetical protein [Bacteroidales bacterium]